LSVVDNQDGNGVIEAIQIGSLRFEFDGDQMKNCRP
jgi:hypothetical protein